MNDLRAQLTEQGYLEGPPAWGEEQASRDAERYRNRKCPECLARRSTFLPYHRDDEYRGLVRCGYCGQTEEVKVSAQPPPHRPGGRPRKTPAEPVQPVVSAPPPEPEPEPLPPPPASQNGAVDPADWMRLTKAAQLLDLSVQSVQRWIRRGRIDGMKLGKWWYVRRDQIAGLFEKPDLTPPPKIDVHGPKTSEWARRVLIRAGIHAEKPAQPPQAS